MFVCMCESMCYLYIIALAASATAACVCLQVKTATDRLRGPQAATKVSELRLPAGVHVCVGVCVCVCVYVYVYVQANLCRECCVGEKECATTRERALAGIAQVYGPLSCCLMPNKIPARKRTTTTTATTMRVITSIYIQSWLDLSACQ